MVGEEVPSMDPYATGSEFYYKREGHWHCRIHDVTDCGPCGRGKRHEAAMRAAIPESRRMPEPAQPAPPSEVKASLNAVGPSQTRSLLAEPVQCESVRTLSFCTTCGEKIAGGWKFCGGCGSPLSASPTTQQPSWVRTVQTQLSPDEAQVAGLGSGDGEPPDGTSVKVTIASGFAFLMSVTSLRSGPQDFTVVFSIFWVIWIGIVYGYAALMRRMGNLVGFLTAMAIHMAIIAIPVLVVVATSPS